MTAEQARTTIAAYGRVMVEYFLAGSRLVIFLARPDGSIAVADTQVDPVALDQAIDRMHQLLRPQDKPDPKRRYLTGDEGDELRRLLRHLGRLLWDAIPWRQADRAAPVMLVPHAQLLRVPFAALIDAEGRPVAATCALSVLPAAAVLPALMARAGTPAGHGQSAAPSLFALVTPEPMSRGLPPLDTLAAEFGPIAARYPGGARVRYGAEATRQALLDVAREPPTVLCFATHAVALPAAPMDSYVMLAPGPGDAASDGALLARDVYGLDLPSRLAILAACDTGTGKVTSDGVIGLSRAFLAAGPRAVLMTLWPVTERDTLRVLGAFHDHYLGGVGPAAALRAAQAADAHRYPDDPRRWAGFTLFGLPD